MVGFSNAKINIGLNIIRKRPDGYHDLETIFYPVNIKDAIEIIEDPGAAEDIIFTSTGHTLNISPKDNLCVKAFRLLQKDFPGLPPLKMHLHKNIPAGAGLGGGSSNAATVLVLLNKKFSLGISEEKLLHYALLLGSDCPFFILNTPCIAKGRGEILLPISLDLSSYKIMIVHPDIHINTAEAFAGLDPRNDTAGGGLRKGIEADISQWKNTLSNYFEKPLSISYPVIKEITDRMYKSGAGYAAMSGTGSSVYGIFEKTIEIDVKFPSYWFCQIV